MPILGIPAPAFMSLCAHSTFHCWAQGDSFYYCLTCSQGCQLPDSSGFLYCALSQCLEQSLTRGMHLCLLSEGMNEYEQQKQEAIGAGFI